MKIKYLVFAIIISSTSTVFAVSPPLLVTQAFNQKFPNVTNVEWEKENAHEYEVEFKWNGESYSANFTDDAKWLETESVISFSQLPDKIQQGFSKDYPNVKLKEVSRIEKPENKTGYEIEFRKGLKKHELSYSADGIETTE
jgi:hypothetical protein